MDFGGDGGGTVKIDGKFEEAVFGFFEGGFEEGDVFYVFIGEVFREVGFEGGAELRKVLLGEADFVEWGKAEVGDDGLAF